MTRRSRSAGNRVQAPASSDSRRSRDSARPRHQRAAPTRPLRDHYLCGIPPIRLTTRIRRSGGRDRPVRGERLRHRRRRGIELVRPGVGFSRFRRTDGSTPWHPQRDSNPCFRLERAMSSAAGRWGPVLAGVRRLPVRLAAASRVRSLRRAVPAQAARGVAPGIVGGRIVGRRSRWGQQPGERVDDQ